MKVLLIAGARPNFMKIAPIYRESLKYKDVDCQNVHTGQHYDYEMSQTFFEDLEIPKPDFFLDAGSGSHAVQTAKVMVAFEEVCIREKPDLVIVVGDVNSTLACSIVAKKLLIKVAHIEAGLRSFDLTMPEEINRMVTDAITDYFFVTEESGRKNLLAEGKPADRVHFVGHVMIDNLLYQVEKMKAGGADSWIYPGQGTPPTHTGMTKKGAGKTGRGADIIKGEYGFMTLHRPSNVDDRNIFMGIVAALNEIAEAMPIFFPVHPRTKKMMEQFQIRLSENIKLLSPLGFKESLYLWKDAKVVLTDSGGLQEETTALGVPCVTIRDNTERPVTIKLGTNVLAGTTKESILNAYQESLSKAKQACIPPLWDGRASERIWKILLR